MKEKLDSFKDKLKSFIELGQPIESDLFEQIIEETCTNKDLAAFVTKYLKNKTSNDIAQINRLKSLKYHLTKKAQELKAKKRARIGDGGALPDAKRQKNSEEQNAVIITGELLVNQIRLLRNQLSSLHRISPEQHKMVLSNFTVFLENYKKFYGIDNDKISDLNKLLSDDNFEKIVFELPFIKIIKKLLETDNDYFLRNKNVIFLLNSEIPSFQEFLELPEEFIAFILKFNRIPKLSLTPEEKESLRKFYSNLSINVEIRNIIYATYGDIDETYLEMAFKQQIKIQVKRILEAPNKILKAFRNRYFNGDNLQLLLWCVNICCNDQSEFRFNIIENILQFDEKYGCQITLNDIISRNGQVLYGKLTDKPEEYYNDSENHLHDSNFRNVITRTTPLSISHLQWQTILDIFQNDECEESSHVILNSLVDLMKTFPYASIEYKLLQQICHSIASNNKVPLNMFIDMLANYPNLYRNIIQTDNVYALIETLNQAIDRSGLPTDENTFKRKKWIKPENLSKAIDNFIQMLIETKVTLEEFNLEDAQEFISKYDINGSHRDKIKSENLEIKTFR